ncbi:MAG TPA: alpha/beta fold hydrolase [Vicinamibacterales bacterium]|nr:alpha/beta fold hydrolase [Vicinamibacterales bacterium]
MTRRAWLLVAITLPGCATSSPAASESPALTTVACEGRTPPGARCATLRVPENRADPERRTIALYTMTLPATGERATPDPVLFLAGGPGQAATSLAGLAEASGLRRSRDIVLADQRGTGRSNGLGCRFYGPPESPQSYFTPFLPLDKVRACRLELAERADLSQYTTEASVADLEALRAAMGRERLNLIGSSYGTRLAMEYVRRHETRVRTVILDGPVPPSVPMPQDFGRLAQASLDHLLEECVATPACNGAFPGIVSEARDVFLRLQRAPVTVTLAHPDGGVTAPVRLTRDHVAEAIRYMTYSSRSAGDVPLALHRAYSGDYRPIAEFLIRDRRDGMFDGLYLSITCTEDVPFLSEDAAARDAPTYLGAYRVREQQAACGEWPRGKAPASRGTPVTANVPVLILAGVLDPVTPPQHGVEIARTLANSRQLTIPFGGHSRAGLDGLECVTGAITAFVERGDFSGVDAACAGSVKRRAFATAR